jgi:hypothetical protein
MASAQNMAVDHDTFWAAHSPGQFLFPGIISLTGIRIGTALRILEVLGIALGLFGYYRLFARTFSFSKEVAILACGAILLNRGTLDNFITYSGGPLLLFAAMPYFLMSTMFCLKRRGIYLALVPLIFLGGTFLKLSFAIVAIGMIGASIFRRLVKQARCARKDVLIQSTLDLCAFGLSYSLLYILHVSQGLTAAHPRIGHSIAELMFFVMYSVSCIMSATVSLFRSLSRLGYYLVFPYPELYQHIPTPWSVVVVAVAALSVVVLIVVVWRVQQTEYRSVLLSLAGVHVAILTSFFLGGNLIAEDRHFWPVSMILLPGLIHLAARIRNKRWRWAVATIMVLPLVYGVWSHRYNVRQTAIGGRSAALALAYPEAGQKVIDLILRLDEDLADGRNVFFFTEPSLALLIHKNAILVTIDPDAAFKSSYRGNVDRLIVVVDDTVLRTNTREKILSSFPSQRTWQTVSVRNRWVLYSGRDAPAALVNCLKEQSCISI